MGLPAYHVLISRTGKKVSMTDWMSLEKYLAGEKKNVRVIQYPWKTNVSCPNREVCI